MISSFLRKQWREWRFMVGFFVLVVLPVRSAVVDWNWVPTGSMKPTIVEGDLVLVNKLSYDLKVRRSPTSAWRGGANRSGAMWWCFSRPRAARVW